MAWSAALMSSSHTRLAQSEETYSALREAYSAVDSANQLQAAAWQAVALAQQAPDQVTAEGFHEQALKLLQWPFEQTQARASEALELLSADGG